MASATSSSFWDQIFPVTTTEELLVEALGEIGPVVALGVPGERLPPLGAARAYTSDATWQGQIADWVRHARLIVMLAGETESFWWEIRHVHASDALAKTCILAPRDTERYERFRAAFAEHIPGVQLPPSPPDTDGRGFFIGAVLSFAVGGDATLIPIARDGPRTKAEWQAILRPLAAATVIS
jgi:hypothetical protein